MLQERKRGMGRKSNRCKYTGACDRGKEHGQIKLAGMEESIKKKGAQMKVDWREGRGVVDNKKRFGEEGQMTTTRKQAPNSVHLPLSVHDP